MLTSLECKVPDMALRTLAERARMARIRAGFVNEKAAADAIGCSRPLVIRWESGEAQSIGGRYLTEAARAYKVRPEWLALTTDDDGYPWDPAAVASSQPGRPDRATLESGIKLVKAVARITQQPLEEAINAASVLVAIEILDEASEPMTDSNVLDFMERYVRRLEERREGDGDQRRSEDQRASR